MLNPWMPKLGSICIILGASLLVGSWSVSTGMKNAEEAVLKFDEMMNAGQCQKVYDQSEMSSSKKVTVELFCGTMESIYRRHGSVEKRLLIKKGVVKKNKNTIVVLVYCTNFAYGLGIDIFRWSIENNRVRLNQYDSDFKFDRKKANLSPNRPYSLCPSTTLSML